MKRVWIFVAIHILYVSTLIVMPHAVVECKQWRATGMGVVMLSMLGSKLSDSAWWTWSSGKKGYSGVSAGKDAPEDVEHLCKETQFQGWCGGVEW